MRQFRSSNAREWSRSLALLLALPVFFVLMGVGIRACQADPCGCPAEVVTPTDR